MSLEQQEFARLSRLSFSAALLTATLLSSLQREKKDAEKRWDPEGIVQALSFMAWGGGRWSGGLASCRTGQKISCCAPTHVVKPSCGNRGH
jgi:hypothetical protein